MYRSSQQTQFPISLSSILWPGEGSNPNLPSIVWNDSSLSAVTDPQFDEANGFPRPGESPIGSSFYVTDQQLPLSTSEILIFRNYVDNVSRWVNYILSSQIPHDESREVYGDACGIKGAVYWTWYRHEIWAALQRGQAMFLDEQYWKPEEVDSFENLCAEDIANRAIFIFGQCVSFCNDKSAAEGVGADERRKIREHRAESLRHALEDWKEKLSTSSANFLSEKPPQTETNTHEFPFLWFLYPQSAIAFQVYHASKILLNLHSYPPMSDGFIIGSSQSLTHRREIEKSREQIFLVSNSGIPDPWSLVSTQCLYIAGIVTEGLLERSHTLELIEDCQKRSGRKTCVLADALRKLWSE
ncbi:hypothetical protein N7452_011027 [Penicillium brevicompactum]|uniref:Uncharacterized protein n=1 Tax=Penicillium brevicompactum TaxID=5074 RepID=A0A9W9Q1D9_PENBR|nr:hypothetical protein N7452_011027 [Penicillium brevicompactum]